MIVRRPVGSLIFAALSAMAASGTHAQLVAPGESGVAMGHLHLTVRDLDASRAFWTAIGGVPVQNGNLQLIQFPGTFVLLRRAEPLGGTVGSTVNHIGFHVKNLEELCRKLEASGVKLDRPYTKLPNSAAAIAFFTDPWGTYVELTENLAPR